MPTISDDITELLEIPSTSKYPLSFSEASLSALYAMSHELYRNGKYEEAKGFFRFLTLVDSLERKYWMGLAACYQMLKCYLEAIECYSAAALQDPFDPYAHWHAADCFFHSGKIVKAKKALESAILAAKENPLHQPLVPQLTLISEAWSSLPNGIPT